MLMCCPITLEHLSRAVPTIYEDQKIALLYAPFKGATLFGGALAKLQKVNTEPANTLLVFPNPAAPSASYFPQPYVGQVETTREAPHEEGARAKKDLLLLLLGLDLLKTVRC